MFSLAKSFIRTAPEIRKLIETPEIQQIFAREDDRNVALRKPHALARKEIIAGKYVKAETAATVKVQAATEKRRLALEALNAAIREENAAFSDSYVASYRGRAEQAKAEGELMVTRDSRLPDFLGCAEVLLQNVRHATACHPVSISKHPFGHIELQWGDNRAAVDPAVYALSNAIANATEMQYEALTREEITLRLQNWVKKLGPLLKPFEKLPPVVSATEVEPGSRFWPEKEMDTSIYKV